MSEWPSTYIGILDYSGPQCIGSLGAQCVATWEIISICFNGEEERGEGRRMGRSSGGRGDFSTIAAMALESRLHRSFLMSVIVESIATIRLLTTSSLPTNYIVGRNSGAILLMVPSSLTQPVPVRSFVTQLTSAINRVERVSHNARSFPLSDP